MLIPIVLEKLPNVVKLQISRKLGGENWNIDEFLNTINDEILARENYEFLKISESDDNMEQIGTTSSLLIAQKKRCCIFCGNQNHSSDRCEFINDVTYTETKVKRFEMLF